MHREFSSLPLEKPMKTLLAVSVGTLSVLAGGPALAQAGPMMGNGSAMWGGGWMAGYGGLLMPILIVAVVASLVAWVLDQIGK
jgi:uncharacterized membrane protein